jgi:hypothetical protein
MSVVSRWRMLVCMAASGEYRPGPPACWAAAALTLVAGQAAAQVQLHPQAVAPPLHPVHALPLPDTAESRQGKQKLR